MRILYSHRVQSRDGQSVHIEALVGAFRAAGHEVEVIGPSFYATAKFGGEDGRIAALRRHLPATAAELAELGYNLLAYRTLMQAIRRFRPDFIYERYNLFYLAGMAGARRARLPFFVEVNAPLADERARNGGLRLKRLAAAGECAVWRAADRVFAVTSVLGTMIEARDVERNSIVVTPNGIDPALFASLPPRDAGRRPVLGFVGFVRPWHGLDLVIEAMAANPSLPFDFVIAGDGPARAELEALAARRGIRDRVRFVGLVPRADIPSLLAGFDIALQPQAVDYASPLKLFEYMAAGCAIVAPDQPNIREVLEDGRDSLLVPANDGAALWRAVVRLASDPALRARLGDNAKARIRERDLTWSGNARRVIGCAEAAIRARSNGQ